MTPAVHCWDGVAVLLGVVQQVPQGLARASGSVWVPREAPFKDDSREKST